MKPIESFQGRYRFLSNFSPAAVKYEGYWYETVEHAYQAAKTLSEEERLKVRMTQRPGEAKKLGRRLTLRPEWDNMKRAVMFTLLTKKFESEELAQRLLETKDALLIEGNEWGDTYWGVCDGVGENHLGKLLMRVRNNLRLAKL